MRMRNLRIALSNRDKCSSDQDKQARLSLY